MQLKLPECLFLSFNHILHSTEIQPLFLSNKAQVNRVCITEYDEGRVMSLFKEEGRKEGGILMLKRLVKDGAISLPNAAKAAEMSVSAFQSYIVNNSISDTGFS